MKFLVDTHSHTIASGHAYSTITEMAEAAAAKGLKALALTEHAPEMPGTCGLFYFQNLDVVPRMQKGDPTAHGRRGQYHGPGRDD